jgi:restriction system protein
MTQSIGMRAVFVGNRILGALISHPELWDEASGNTLLSAYRHCMGDDWSNKHNLYGFHRLLGELGVEKPPMADLIERCSSLESRTSVSMQEIDEAFGAQIASKLDLDDELSQIKRSFQIAMQENDRRAILRSIEQVIRAHKHTLARKRLQLRLEDDYGTIDDERWWNEVTYFVERVIIPAVSTRLDEYTITYITSLIDEIAAEPIIKDESLYPCQEILSPSEFEHYCAEVLSRQNWTTRLTKSTGDQGVDIIAERGGLTMVVQCKLYGTAVGNSAVQEIHAGKGFMNADLGVVVSNADFTRSAKELAASLGVILASVSELAELDKRLFLKLRDKN